MFIFLLLNRLYFRVLFKNVYLFINSVVFVSGVPPIYSVIHIHTSVLFQILFPFRLLQNIEQSSLCCTGPYWVSVLSIAVYTCQWGTTLNKMFTGHLLCARNYSVTFFLLTDLILTTQSLRFI